VINASPLRIWQVLSDAATLASGPFGILRIDGVILPGSKLKLWSEAAPKRAFALTVSGFEPGRRMVWTGGMPLGLFTGTRTFTLTPQGDRTEFHMREVFSGPLAGLIGRSMPDLNPSFRKFTSALATASEEKS
jgi:hypothetical protein